MAGENNGASAGICDQSEPVQYSEEGIKRMGVSQYWSYVLFFGFFFPQST